MKKYIQYYAICALAIVSLIIIGIPAWMGSKWCQAWLGIMVMLVDDLQPNRM